MASITPNGHAWRAAKIHELGTRMGGYRAVYRRAAEYAGDAEPYHDAQFLQHDDPKEIKQLLVILRVYTAFILGAMARSPGSEFTTSTWKSLVKAGVIELYLDIVESKGFLAENVRLMDLVVPVLCFIVQEAKNDPAVTKLLLIRLRDVWKSFWDTRDLIRAYSQRSPLVGETEKYQEFTTVLLREYCYLYAHRYSCSPPAETYAPHMGLLFWMRDKHVDLTNCASWALKSLSGLAVPNIRHSRGHIASENFVQEAIIDGVGLQAFCERLDFDISRQYHPEVLHKGDYDAWNDLVGLIVTPQVLPYFLARGTLDSLMNLRAALANMPGRRDEAHYAFNRTYDIFVATFRDQWRPHIERPDTAQVPHLPGEYLVNMMAVGLHQAAMRGYKDLRGSVAGHFLYQDLMFTTTFFNDLSKEPRRFRSEAHALFAQCRASAPDQWYTALNAVQVAGYRNVLDQELCRLLTHGWIIFGKALGLRPDKERARLQHLKRIHCAWSLCAHHQAEPDVQLKACQGCGEVRYCSRECQKSDWKEHKGHCGNRLKAEDKARK